jgi:hypothetical protein
LASSHVEFVIVGVGGINFYARDPTQAFSTLDLDVLLAPEPGNLRQALQALSQCGFSFQAGGEPFLDLDDDETLTNIVRVGANLTARHADGAQLDLMLSIRGFSYSDLATDARAFAVGEVEIRVGQLEKLLRSKELTARPKDREFLRQFEAQAAEDDSN